MPTTGIKAAVQIAIGAEVTPGTTVARTRRLLTRTATYKEIEEHESFDGHMHGTLARVMTAPVISRAVTELDLPLDLDFEQVLLAMLGGVDGSVTPTTPGTGEARLWTFEPVPTVTVDPKTYSLEWVESNFASSPDHAARLAGYGFVSGFELKASDNGVPELSLSLVARKAAAATKTTIALPTLNRIANARWRAYLDTTWAGLGTTQISGQIYGFTYKFSGYLRPAYYLDGRANADFATHEFGLRTAELSMDVVHDPAAGKLVPAEVTAKAVPSLRFVRLDITGSAFTAPDAALSRFIRLDGAYYHAPDSLQERGGDRDGNLITRVHLLSAYDPTAARDVRFTVQNNLATFP